MASIEAEIQQKEFNSEFLKAHVNVLFTASWLNNRLGTLLKAYKLTTPQFNVLRILRGAIGTAISVKELTGKMIDKSSNASRLIDKLEKKGLVQRTLNTEDRRRVDVVITKKGIDAVNKASLEVEKIIDELFINLNIEEAMQLNSLLDKIRSL